MRIYEQKFHEFLIVNWYTGLRADAEEFNKLFLPDLQNLTELLNWAAHRVKLFIDFDEQGLSRAAWLTPIMSGAEAGAWVRKDQRKSGQSVVFMNRFYDTALAAFPVIMGITCQPELHKIHLLLGYEKVGEVPHLYGGRVAVIYAMTRETRNGRRRHLQEFKLDKRPVRRKAGVDRPPDVPEREADDGGAGIPDAGGFADGRSEQPAPRSKRKRRQRAASLQRPSPEPQESVGSSGIGE